MKRNGTIAIVALSVVLVGSLALSFKMAIDKRTVSTVLQQYAEVVPLVMPRASGGGEIRGMLAEVKDNIQAGRYAAAVSGLSELSAATGEPAAGSRGGFDFGGSRGEDAGLGSEGRRERRASMGGGGDVPTPKRADRPGEGEARAQPRAGLLSAVQDDPELRDMVQGLMEAARDKREKGFDVMPAMQKLQGVSEHVRAGDRERAVSLLREAEQALKDAKAQPASEGARGARYRGGEGRGDAAGEVGLRPQARAGSASGPRPTGEQARRTDSERPTPRSQMVPRAGRRQAPEASTPSGAEVETGRAAPDRSQRLWETESPAAAKRQTAESLPMLNKARETIENAKVAILEKNQDQLVEILDRALASLDSAAAAQSELAGPRTASVGGGDFSRRPGDVSIRTSEAAILGERVQSAILEAFDTVRDLSPAEYREKRAQISTGMLVQLLASAQDRERWTDAGRGAGVPPTSERRFPMGRRPGGGTERAAQVFPRPQDMTFEAIQDLFELLRPAYEDKAASGEDMTEIDELLAGAREALHSSRLDEAYKLLHEVATQLAFSAPEAARNIQPAQE